MTLLVNEIFYSIQGESLYAGRPCIFIRLSGCNLRCSYCDTRYAYNEGKEMQFLEIFDKISRFNCSLVEITGGEPLFQPESKILINDLLARGYEVMLETNGSIKLEGVDSGCIKIVDIKCPSSGESEKNEWENLNYLYPDDQIKFVIGNSNDYKYAKEVLKTYSIKIPKHNILFSPVFGNMEPSVLAEWILKDLLEVRLHLQIHKILWPNQERGV